MIRLLRQVLPYTAVGLAMALLYLFSVALSRQSADLKLAVTKQRGETQAAGVPPELAGSDLKILHFYASPGEIVEGGSANICYGVLNAESVRIEPAVERLHPALNRCISVTPGRGGDYKLIAEGRGMTATAAFHLTVNPPPPYILFLAVSDKEIKRGESLTMCYGVKDATAVRLEPGSRALPVLDKVCFKLHPLQTTKYSIVADGRNGATDKLALTITVR